MARPLRGIVWLGVAAALVFGPVALNEFRLLLLTEIVIFGLAAASLGLLVGFTGLPSLGHAAYFGIGAYASGLVAIHSTDQALVQVLVGSAVAAAAAAVTGALAVRAHGPYFLMLTLSFGQIFMTLALTWTDVTGGTNGLSGVPTPTLISGTTLALSDTTNRYHYVLAVATLVFAGMVTLVKSPLGRTFVGIRDNESRMRALGYRVRGYKFASFCIAGAVAGVAGTLYMQHSRFVAPTSLGFSASALLLVMVIIGGRRTLYGPLLGAGIVLLMRDELSSRLGDRWQLALGVTFVAIVYLLPQGAVPALAALAARVRRAVSSRQGTAHDDAFRGSASMDRSDVSLRASPVREGMAGR